MQKILYNNEEWFIYNKDDRGIYMILKKIDGNAFGTQYKVDYCKKQDFKILN